MPETPVSAKSYADAGLPWFEIYDERVPVVAPCEALAAVQPVQAMQAASGEAVVEPVERDVHPSRVSEGEWGEEEVTLAQPATDAGDGEHGEEQQEREGDVVAVEVARVIEAAWADVEPQVVISFNLPEVIAAQRRHHRQQQQQREEEEQAGGGLPAAAALEAGGGAAGGGVTMARRASIRGRTSTRRRGSAEGEESLLQDADREELIHGPDTGGGGGPLAWIAVRFAACVGRN